VAPSRGSEATDSKRSDRLGGDRLVAGMSAPELSVVCKSCGSEVSPYVTECPYCGARLRKRAPKLQRRGESLEARQQRGRRLRFGRSRLKALAGVRPIATTSVLGASAAMVLVQRATDRSLFDLGGIAAPVGSEWWRYLTAPFAYMDIGYLFVIGVALALFAPAWSAAWAASPPCCCWSPAGRSACSRQTVRRRHAAT